MKFVVPLVLLFWGTMLRPGLAADVSYFGMVKSIRYEQTNGPAPALLSSNAYNFTAFVVPATNHLVTNATLKVSNSALVRTLAADTNEASLTLSESFNSQSELDSAYPAGSVLSKANYAFTMYTTNDGIQTASLNFFLLILAVTYPPAPQLSNLSEAQHIDSTRDFDLTWEPLGGTALTIVQLSIMDAASNIVFATPAPFQPGALSSSSLSVTIPAYALPAGSNWFGHLTVANPGSPNTNSYPGATGVPALAKDTEFRLATRAAPQPPRLEWVGGPSTQATIRVSGETNWIYRIETSADLAGWSKVFTTNSVTGTFDYKDPDPPVLARRYYRAAVGQ